MDMTVIIQLYCQLYRVIHKSVKHFKYSQQISYSTDHGSSYADRERETIQVFFYIFHRCSICPHLVIRQTSKRQSISFHTRVSKSRSTRATAAVIRLRKCGDQRGVEAQRQCPSQTPRRKSRNGVKSGAQGGYHIKASSFFLVRSIHFCGKFRLRYARKFL